MSKKTEVDLIKKLENGKIAVKWKGDKKFYVIEDQEVAVALIWMIVNKKSGQERQVDAFI